MIWATVSLTDHKRPGERPDVMVSASTHQIEIFDDVVGPVGIPIPLGALAVS